MPVRPNMVEAGDTPSFTADEAREYGFKIMIVPFVTIALAYDATKEDLQHLKATGSTMKAKEMRPQTLFRICGLDASMTLDTEAGGQIFAGGVD